MRDQSLPILGQSNAGLLPHPSKLFVEVTTRCNLHCAMCVKEAQGQRIREGDMTRETYERLAPAFPHLQALILNGIGEPLLNRNLEHFVELAKRDMPASGWIGFQTNGQLLGAKRAQSLASAGVDRICISADAVSPDVFSSLRRGGRHEAIENAAAALHAAAAQRGRPIALGIEFVAMRENLDQLPELVRWAARTGVGFIIVTHMLPYSAEMTHAVAFDAATDRAVRLFSDWKARACAEGVDLSRYFDVFLKFRPSPDEQRVIEYVRNMVDDASAQGITLYLARLLGYDPSVSHRVASAFAEAAGDRRARGHRPAATRLDADAAAAVRVRRETAVRSSPGMAACTPAISCGTATAATCAGMVKHVQPRSFGNLAEQDILAIWNDEAARAFREAVLRYEFPFCYDCNHALCDYVQAEEFTQDCHLNTVPCAACLWCTGVFQCLQ